jgi:hypothetical protein
MKPRMMSKNNMDYLFDHILGGFEKSHEGIHNLKQQGLVDDQVIKDLLDKNSKRLIDRIKEFKITQKLTCIVFAFMFGYMQISGDDIERARRSRKARSRRRQEYEYIEDL